MHLQPVYCQVKGGGQGIAVCDLWSREERGGEEGVGRGGEERVERSREGRGEQGGDGRGGGSREESGGVWKSGRIKSMRNGVVQSEARSKRSEGAESEQHCMN